MSKVYSFRLDESNPREAQAKEVINAWVSKGYSVRHILTNALNSFSDSNNNRDDLSTLINQLMEIIEISKIEKMEEIAEKKSSEPLPLNSTFISELGKIMKVGLRIK